MPEKEYNPAKVKKIIDESILFFQNKIEEGKRYYERILTLYEALKQVTTENDYRTLTDEVIRLQYELSNFLENIRRLDPFIVANLNKIVNKYKSLSFFSSLIDFDELSKEKILSAKERLSLSDLNASLPQDKAKEALNFIASIKQLKDVASLLNREALSIREQLHQHPSIEDLNRLDLDTTQMSEALLKLLQNTLMYPEDEETAAAIVKYLEDNPHIRNILHSFDFRERLEDEFLFARASMS